MPDLVAHYYFGEEVLKKIPSEIKERITNQNLYLFTTAGPDPFFFYKFLNGKKNKEVREFGNYMHRHSTKRFFEELINRCKVSKNKDILFSYLTGFIAHYSLDSIAHPYIFHKTGEYLGTKETLHYRGLHTKLERAIDSYIIRVYYFKKPWKFKISKEVLKLKRLPQEIYEDLDEVYLKAFDYKNASKIINETVKDQIDFYNFIHDPVGLKQELFEIIDNGKSGLDYTKFSYYHKEIDDVDIFNLNHKKWVNPVDDRIYSFDSFWDLFEKAKKKAQELIEISYDIIYLNKEVNLDLYFENLSYLTGINCSKENAHDMKYFDNIFEGE